MGIVTSFYFSMNLILKSEKKLELDDKSVEQNKMKAEKLLSLGLN